MRAHTIRSRSHTQTLRADLERENLPRNHPRNRAPRSGEEKDEDANKCDPRLLCGDVVDNNVARGVLGGGGCA